MAFGVSGSAALAMVVMQAEPAWIDWPEITNGIIIGVVVAIVLAVLARVWLFPRFLARKTRQALAPTAGWPIHSNLNSQPKPPEFVGRQAKIDAITGLLDRGHSTVVQAAVTGTGGIGKTALALEVARRMQRRFEGVWVIPAASIDSLQDSLISLAQELKTPQAGHSNRAEAADSALRAVAERGKPWLLLYDNADDPAAIQRHAPQLPENSAIRRLFTSRRKDWPEYQTVPLDRMERGEARALLDSRLSRKAGKKELERLAKRLDDWPLALVAAAGYLNLYDSVTIDDYIARFDASREEMGKLGWPGCEYFDQNRAETHSLAAALALSTDALGEDDKALLSVLAWLAPDDLWPEMVEKGVRSEAEKPFDDTPMPEFFQRAGADPALIRAGFDRLHKASLIEPEGEGSWRLHRMTGEFWRARHAPPDPWAEVAARIVNSSAPYDADSQTTWATYRRLLPHARALLDGGAHGPAAARLFHQVGLYALNRGEQEGDLDFARRAVEIREATAPGSEALAASLTNLSQFHDALGDLDAALASLNRTAEIERAHPDIGPRHPAHATTLNNIAGIHRARGDYPAAEDLCQQALDIDKDALGPDHPETIMRLRNLGTLYHEWAQRAKDAEAEDLRAKEADFNSRASAAARRALGPWHQSVALDLYNEAARLWAADDVAAAIAPMRQAAAVFLDILGGAHPWTQGSVRAGLEFCDAAGADKAEFLSSLRAEAASARAAHRVWGNEKLNELCQRHGVTADDQQTALAELRDRIVAEVQRLEKAGKPPELYTWVAQEFNEALHAVQLDPAPRADFDDQLAQALAAIGARPGD